MQVTSLVSRLDNGRKCSCDHDHSHDHGSHDHHGHDHQHTPVHLPQMLVGLILVLNSFLVEWIFGKNNMVGGLSAMLGAIVLGVPIVWTSVKGPFARHPEHQRIGEHRRARRVCLGQLDLCRGRVRVRGRGLPDRGHRGVLHVVGRDHRDPHRRRRPGLDRVVDQAHPDEGPPPQRERGGGGRDPRTQGGRSGPRASR